MQRKLLVAAMLLQVFYCFCQAPGKRLSAPVDLNIKDKALSFVLEELELQCGLTFTYSNDDVNVDRRVSVDVTRQPLNIVLARLFNTGQFTFREKGKKIFILKTATTALFQTIRGEVREAETNLPIPGANVIVLNSEPMLGASTDQLGRFRIEKVPIGRQSIKVTFTGFLPKNLSTLELNTGKELVLDIRLEESVTELQSVIVTDRFDKSRPLNEMALISAKSFSVEETSRYAGSFNDPARMATSYAGVVGSQDDTENGIIVRGNSPRGLLWRLEGMEIPNPNHFASDGSSSGAISMLNSNVMTNSDFLTGAFPAEYGNAFSGVFDMKLRNGNNEKREYAIQAGLLGLDASFEGPIRRKSDQNVANASYLINYRYSTISMLESLGLNIAGDGGQVPAFQDLAFKFNVPTARAGTFSIYGLGGFSDSSDDYSVEEAGEVFDLEDREEYKLGLLGANHIINVSSSSFLESGLSYARYDYDYIFENVFEGVPFVEDTESYQNENLRLSSVLNTKFSAQHTTKLGFIYTLNAFDLNSRGFFDDSQPSYVSDESGSFSMYQAFVSHKYKLTNELVFTGGLHYIRLDLAGQDNLEPRFGLKWQFKPRQSLSFGFGMHSRKEETSLYFTEILSDQNTTQLPNKNLGLAKAKHFVIGYSNKLGADLNLQIEAYYQDLYDIPVSADAESDYSSLNQQDAFQRLNLVNEGTGKNYGVELTLEKYLSRGYFFLLTGTLYESRYTTLTGLEYNTRYNGKYNVNFVGGKEFKLGSLSRQKTLNIGFESVFGGGTRVREIDLQASIDEGTTVFRNNTPFARQLKDYARIDFQVSIKTNKKGITHEWKLDIQNLTGRRNVISERFSTVTNQIVQSGFTGEMIPVLSYKITF